MLLDANAFAPQLTPEVALGIVKKALVQRGWVAFDVSSVKLVYSPFYVFSFDVQSEGNVPTGRAALNAFSGELSDFVPLLFERPLNKTRQVNEKEADVEDTTIQLHEVKDAGAGKIAAQTGVKKDAITISAVSKAYVPFYRVWVNVADDTFRVDVDGSLGAPFGLDALPVKEKGWEDATREAVAKMKSPAGWLELLGSALGAFTGKGRGRAGGGPLAGRQTRLLLLLGVIVVLVFLVSRPAAVDAACAADPQFVQSESFFGLAPRDVLNPAVVTVGGERFFELTGTCAFTNRANRELVAVARVILQERGQDTRVFNSSIVRLAASDAPVQRPFSLRWPFAAHEPYSLRVDVTTSNA